LGVILFIMEFGAPPFEMATKSNNYYRYFYREPNMMKLFFRLHPSSKELHAKGQLNHDLMELLLALLNENPEKRPKNVAEIRQFAYLQKASSEDSEVAMEMTKRLSEMKKNL
jgi:serine/threonine protein kinase